MKDFSPDVKIAKPTEVTIGGTRFQLLPVNGGETEDAMFIHLPDDSILFVGDFIMPYIGAPFFEEGNIQGLFDAIDLVAERNPRYLLHGHEPLTSNFNSPALLTSLKKHLKWLQQETIRTIQVGTNRADIHQQNLIPSFIHENPIIHIPFLVLRENFINRIYDQNVGYWQPVVRK